MQPQPSEKPDMHSEEFLHSLMRKQLRLSIVCAATFMVVLLALPLANYFFPDVMATRVFGFTLTWFILGVLFFPFVWIIAWLFIRRSIALEESEVREVAGTEKLQAPTSNIQRSSNDPSSKGASLLVLMFGICFIMQQFPRGKLYDERLFKYH